MRCTAIALGASVIAVALTAGPAMAEPGPIQSVDDTTGAAQVGPVAVDAPVRVASDGGGSSAGVTTGAPQTTNGSTGAAQLTSVQANAPVRVLSDGEDTGAASSGQAAAAPQTSGDSTGTAQVGSAGVDAPVRVASDGDNGAAEAAPGGEQSVGASNGSAQVGSPMLAAPVRVLSEDGGAPDDGLADAVDEAQGDLTGELQGSPADPASPSDPSPQVGEAPAGSGAPEGLRQLVDDETGEPDTEPAVQFVSGGTGDDAGGEADVATLGVADTSLPLTGARVIAFVGVGLWLLASGAALRLVPGGGKRR